jgi:hypothetical protein
MTEDLSESGAGRTEECGMLTWAEMATNGDPVRATSSPLGTDLKPPDLILLSKPEKDDFRNLTDASNIR